MSDQIHALEEKLAFLERHVEQLDVVVRSQHERLDAFQTELDRLRKELRRASEPHEESSPEDEVPPHWGRG